MPIHFNDSLNSAGGIQCDMTAPEWCVGIWKHHGGAQGNSGFLWQANVGAPASFSALMTGNDQISLFDTGNSNAAATQRRRFLAGGKDQAGNWFGPTSFNEGATWSGCWSKQYENANTWRELLITQRRAGVSEVWSCIPGFRPRLIASSATTWTGLSAQSTMGFGVSRVGITAAYNYRIDSPFHIGGRALSPAEMERICHGESADSVNSGDYAKVWIAFVSITLAGISDTVAAWNLTNGSSITLNGRQITFVTAAPVGNQVLIGADANATIANLVAFCNGATGDSLLNVATYSSPVGNRLKIVHKTAGAAGASYTLAASSANMRLPLSGRLGYVDYEFATLTSAGWSQTQNGGGYLARSAVTGWGTAGANFADTVLKPDAVTLDPWDAGQVKQHEGGFLDLNLTGGYLGEQPTGIQIELRDLANDSIILGATLLSDFSAGGGSWSGKLSGVPKGKRWLSFRMVKQGKTDYTQTEVPMGVGEVVELSGQSLVVLLSSVPTTITPTGAVSCYMSSDYTDSVVQLNTLWPADSAWHRAKTLAEGPEGHTQFGEAVAAAADCVVGIFNRARGATTIESINSDTEWAKRIVDLNNSKCGRVGWYLFNHGHANIGQGGYGLKLDDLLAKVRSNYGAACNFGLMLMSNVQNSVDGTAAAYFIRQQQDQWLKAKMTVDPGVFSCGAIIDLDLPSDGVHPSGNERLKLCERFARGMLYQMGLTPINADGPLPFRATRVGAVIDVAFRLQGGESLIKTVGDVAPTGFDVSANGFTSLLAISSVAIVFPNIVRITLSANPGAEVDVLYGWGRPGNKAGDAGREAQTTLYSSAQSAELYGDTAPLIAGVTVGKPAQNTYAALRTSAPSLGGSALLI